MRENELMPDLNNADGESIVDSPETLVKIFDEAPPEKREMMFQAVTEIFMAQINPESKLSGKITEKHITDYLDGSRENMRLAYQDKKHRRVFRLIPVGLGGIFVIIFIVLLKDAPELLEKLTYGFFGLVGGALGGYGYGMKRSRPDDD